MKIRRIQTRRSLTSQSSFTLVEIVLAIGITAIVTMSVAALRNNLIFTNKFLSDTLQSGQDITPTLQTMTREIRSASPSSLGAYPIEAAGTSSLTLYSDIDGDGLVERVRYFLATSTVEKGVVKPSGSPLAYVPSTEAVTDVIPNVVTSGPIATSTLFQYFDAAYTGTEAPMAYPIDTSKIRVVIFSVFVSTTSTADVNPKFFTQTIDVRNLRSN